jgi:hypothetical protein
MSPFLIFRRCQTYEGGFGGFPGMEAHGGYTFCAVAVLILLNREKLMDSDRLLRWLSFRQMSLEGGFAVRSFRCIVDLGVGIPQNISTNRLIFMYFREGRISLWTAVTHFGKGLPLPFSVRPTSVPSRRMLTGSSTRSLSKNIF